MRVEIGGQATGPLAGIRVLDLSTIVSGPLCSQVLGDLGADVIKVETAIGDTARYLGGHRRADMTGFFAQFNRNKRSVVLDLKTDGGAAALRRLAAGADVIIENFRPGVMDRLGIGYEALSEDHPELIYVAISGFGPDGPYREQPAYDMIVQALSGFSKLLGSSDKPQLISNLVADKTSGITAAWATLAALFSRERDGRGQRVDIPMLDAFAGFVLPDAFGARAFGEPQEDNSLGEMIYRAWKTADGHVATLVVEDHQFEALCRVMDRDDLLADPRFGSLIGRLQNASELFGVMEVELRKFTTAELTRRAHDHGAPLGAVNDIDAFLADPQVQHNQTVFELKHPEAGPIAVFRSAPRFQRTPSDVRRVPPKLGEHTEEVLREAGLTVEEIATLTEPPGSRR